VREGAASPNRVTLTLKAEATGKVTGTMAGLPNPADVKDGTYDAKTSVLKLSLAKVDEPAVLLVFDGKVVKDVASGTIAGQVTGHLQHHQVEVARPLSPLLWQRVGDDAGRGARRRAGRRS